MSGLGVSQAPAVVIVGKNRKARLIEGFVDRARSVSRSRTRGERRPDPRAPDGLGAAAALKPNVDATGLTAADCAAPARRGSSPT